MASDPTDPNVLYIVYHDFDEAPQDPEDDADVDVYLIRGEYNSQSEEWEWSERIRINDDDPDVEHDQFFPTIVVDDYGDLHIAWFDTRNDPQGPDDDVLISLFYAFSNDGGETFTNHEIDEVAIFNRPLDRSEVAALMNTNDVASVGGSRPQVIVGISGRPRSGQFGQLRVNGGRGSARTAGSRRRWRLWADTR